MLKKNKLLACIMEANYSKLILGENSIFHVGKRINIYIKKKKHHWKNDHNSIFLLTYWVHTFSWPESIVSCIDQWKSEGAL